MASRVMVPSAPAFARVQIWLASDDRPFDAIGRGRAEGHRGVLYAVVEKAITSLDPPASTKKPIKRGRVRLQSIRTVKKEPKDPIYSSDSESETSYSYGDNYSPRTPHKNGSAERLASHVLFSSAYIIKATDGYGDSRGHGAAGISSQGESSSSTPSGGSTGGGAGNRPNKRKHQSDDQGGRSKKPHVSDPQEPDLASPCVFFLAEPNASKFQEGGSHAACKTKTFIKISDHNQHINRNHPPKKCPRCGLEIIDTEKAQEDHRCCPGQREAPAGKENDRCHSWKNVAERCLGDLSAYPKVMSHIEFRKAAVDIPKAFKLFMQEDVVAQRITDALRVSFFRSSQFKNVVQKHQVLNEFKSTNGPDPHWDIGEIVWKTLWRETPETPGTSNLAQGVDIDKSTVHSKNQPFKAASETGGNDTSTKNCSPNSVETSPLYPPLIPNAHHQPGADPMNSSTPSSNPQALVPNVPQEDLSDTQLRTRGANGSSSSQLRGGSNHLRNDSRASRGRPARQLGGGGQAPAPKTPKPNAGPPAGTSHAPGDQAPSAPTPPQYQRNQWGPSKGDQVQSGSQSYQSRPPDPPGTPQPSSQPINGFHSDKYNNHCTTMRDRRMGGDQMGVDNPQMGLGDLMEGLSGVNEPSNSRSQYPAPGNGVYLQGPDPVCYGQITASVSGYAQYSRLTEPYPQANPPNDLNSMLATKSLDHETYPHTDQPNPHNYQPFGHSLPTEATEEGPPYFFQDGFPFHNP